MPELSTPGPPGPAEATGRRIALVLGSSTGGVGQHVRSVAAGLVETGARVAVAGSAATQERFDFAATGAAFVPVEISTRPRPGDAAVIRVLRSRLREADLVHAHGLRAGALAGLACPRHIPLVVTWHNLVTERGPAAVMVWALESFVARRATVSVVASDDLAPRVRSRGARNVRLGEVAAPERAVNRPVGEVRAELGAGQRPLVVTVARLHPQKGLDVLIEAAVAVAYHRPAGSSPDAQDGPPLFVVAGDGPLRDSLQRRIDDTAAPVVLLGHRDDVPDLLAAADLVVVSSVWEARSLAAQEALRAGRPLVATDVGGIPDLVGDGALLVPPGDPGRMAATVLRLLADPAAAGELSRRGSARAASWPDEAGTVSWLRGLYDELCATR